MAEERQAAEILQERLESQSNHSFNMTVVRGVIWNERLGMILLVALALGAMFLGVRIMELGHSAEGFAMIVGAACGALVAFVRSVNRRRQLVDATEAA